MIPERFPVSFPLSSHSTWIPVSISISISISLYVYISVPPAPEEISYLLLNNEPQMSISYWSSLLLKLNSLPFPLLNPGLLPTLNMLTGDNTVHLISQGRNLRSCRYLPLFISHPLNLQVSLTLPSSHPLDPPSPHHPPHSCLIQTILGSSLESGNRFQIGSTASRLISPPSKRLTKLVLLKHKSNSS